MFDNCVCVSCMCVCVCMCMKLEWEIKSLTASLRRFRSGEPANQNILCKCGRDLTEMDATKVYNGNSAICCDGCGNDIDRSHKVYHCNATYVLSHLQGYDLCVKCAFARKKTQHLGDLKCDICNKNLIATHGVDVYGAHSTVICDKCRKNVGKDSVIFHCEKGKSKLHPGGFDVCVECASEMSVGGGGGGAGGGGNLLNANKKVWFFCLWLGLK